ncbi:protein tyrosine phosphatase family protein [Shewanella psychrotolerans]|uniref:protein tyrosine phosphatase family protein n=1 Tax=Shewanella psychrotolerans TaxID=2864206 RepID=UPI001C65D040|nr:protein tyrosine phosphatase family protein [Shewanella psychrotolerans]QYK02500.1 protein tyrosine phosphatase family protein [Shewanella psychrotolerans]
MPSHIYLRKRLTSFVTSLTILLGSATSAHAAITPTSLSNIKAIRFNSDTVITSGLPTTNQFDELEQAGVDLVINLIPNDNPNGHKNEAQLVADAQMQYAHISVDWQQPTLADVEQFFTIMDANKDKDILVHCAANYRASAFYYLYEATKLNHPENQSITMSPWGDLESSLTEYPQWQSLIEKVKNKYLTSTE